MNNGRNGGNGRAKVPVPYNLEERNVTIQSLRRWFNTINNYNKQNDENLQFYEGEEHAEWVAYSRDPTRGLQVESRPEVAADGGNPRIPGIDADEAARLSRRLRRDLDTLLNNYASYVPVAFYDIVLEEATSIKWIFNNNTLEKTTHYNMERSTHYNIGFTFSPFSPHLTFYSLFISR